MGNLGGIFPNLWQLNWTAVWWKEMSLTVQEIEEKIERTKKDLELARTAADSTRKVEVLTEFLEMLEEDLHNAKHPS